MIDKSRPNLRRRKRGTLPQFAPVPRKYNRYDGWTPERQRGFIEALADLGSVRAAAHAVNMTPEGAYSPHSPFRVCWRGPSAGITAGLSATGSLSLWGERRGEGFRSSYFAQSSPRARLPEGRLRCLTTHCCSRSGSPDSPEPRWSAFFRRRQDCPHAGHRRVRLPA